MTPLVKAFGELQAAHEKLFSGAFSVVSHTYYPDKDKLSAGLTTTEKGHTQEAFVLTLTAEELYSDPSAGGYKVSLRCTASSAEMHVAARDLLAFLRHAKVSFATDLQPMKLLYGAA